MMEINEQKFKIIDSTNSEAQRQLSSGEAPKEDFVIRAEFQTEGRGQRGHVWTSQHSENLTFSYVFFPEKLEVQNQFRLSQTASLAVAEFLKANGIENVYIKWPNDVYVGMKKICGMLIENSLSGHYIKSSILGIGINVNQCIFPENIPNPVSMTNITGKLYNLDEKFYQITSILKAGLDNLKKENFSTLKANYMSYLLGLNRTLIYSAKGRIFKGIIKDVDDKGFITVADEVTGRVDIYDFNQINLIIPEQKKN
ncbi:MAG: biotin--[Bacteroidales bacterium]|nr:biotin--[acetyl-CoA-carboxylase] ligase [Bacteroidales bacterium]